MKGGISTNQTWEFPTSLTLDLLSGPTGRLLCSRRELLVGTSLAAHGRQPLVTEVVAEFAVREGFGDVAANVVSER